MNRDLKSYLYSKEPKDVELAHIALGYALAKVSTKVRKLKVLDNLASTMLVSPDKILKYSDVMHNYLNNDSPLNVYADSFHNFLKLDKIFGDNVALIDNDIYAFTSLYRSANELIGGIDV